MSDMARILAEALAAARDEMRDNPFRLGDLVTPRKGGTLRGAGQPHIVVDVRKNAEPVFGNDPSSHDFGIAPDVRVLSVFGDKVVTHWAESWMLEPYTGETEVTTMLALRVLSEAATALALAAVVILCAVAASPATTLSPLGEPEAADLLLSWAILVFGCIAAITIIIAALIWPVDVPGDDDLDPTWKGPLE